MFISDRLVEFVASSTLPPWAVLEELPLGEEHPLAIDLAAAMDSVDSELRDEWLSDRSSRMLYSDPPTVDDLVRLRRNIVADTASRLAYEARARALTGLGEPAPARPYGHPSLEGVTPDEHGLVPLASFDRNPRQVQRADYVFQIAPTLAAPNSSYWLAQLLLAMAMEYSIRVRLDPFMVSHVSEYSAMCYAMRVYGRPLDWERLARLREPEHAEWIPDDLKPDRDVHSTQMVWDPRDDGVHFRCEEIPMDAHERPGRYAHAIYDRENRDFVHADGGIRFYTPEELAVRQEQHVRNAGKAGVRVKLFSFDEPLPRDAWSNVMAGLYVWNEDIREYVTGQRMPDV